MVNIDWNIVATIMVPALITLFLALLTYSLNERAKRKDMKRQRLWNHKCDKFERLVDIFSRKFNLRLARCDLDRLGSGTMGLEEKKSELAQILGSLSYMYPQHFESSGLPRARELFDKKDTTAEEVEYVRGKVHDSLTTLFFGFVSEYFSIVSIVRMHMVNPKVIHHMREVHRFIAGMPEASLKKRRSPEDWRMAFAGVLENLEDSMRKELDDTLRM